MQVVAAAPRQSLGVGEDHRRARGLGETPEERHGVGRAAEEFRPLALAHAWRLVGQHADRLARLERPQQHSHPFQVGTGEAHVATVAASLDQRFDASFFGRPVEDGERRIEGVVLRGDLEAAQVRSQENDAATAFLRGFDQVPTAHLHYPRGHFLMCPQPERRQLEQAFARFGHGSTARRLVAKPGLRKVSIEKMTVTRREPIHDRAKCSAEEVGERQR